VKRAVVVTSGNLSTCPRMVKAADALVEAGWQVRVISTITGGWAADFDRVVHARRRWRWDPIVLTRREARARWLIGGIRSRVARIAARWGRRPWPDAVAAHAFSRAHAELVAAVLREPQELVYGGTSGALAALAEASRISGTPCGIDFEDFHCGQGGDDPDGRLYNELAAAVMARAVGQASFLTAGSAAIAAACETRFGARVLPINNVFPLPRGPQPAPAGGPLRLYWFSQTLGSGRGLEEILTAAGRAGVPCELHLRGRADAAHDRSLRERAARDAPNVAVYVHLPADPDRMVERCRGFDAGLSVEQPDTTARTLCLTNKALTYPLAGLALVMTRTPGHEPLAADLRSDAIVYDPGDVRTLADGLAAWAGDRRLLQRARDAAWEAARTRWHWEHPLERGRFLEAASAVA